MAIRFQFDETKAVETLAYIATRWPRRDSLLRF